MCYTINLVQNNFGNIYVRREINLGTHFIKASIFKKNIEQLRILAVETPLHVCKEKLRYSKLSVINTRNNKSCFSGVKQRFNVQYLADQVDVLAYEFSRSYLKKKTQQMSPSHTSLAYSHGNMLITITFNVHKEKCVCRQEGQTFFPACLHL